MRGCLVREGTRMVEQDQVIEASAVLLELIKGLVGDSRQEGVCALSRAD